MSTLYMPADIPAHEQLDIHAALPDTGIYDHHLRVAWPCAVPGIDLTDYSKNALQKGWGPHCVGPFTTVTLTNGVKITVDSRIAELVMLLGNATLRGGYAIRQADTGAYVCRYVAGTTVWSNHAWGLAVDIDWQSNPQHSPLTTDEPVWMRQLWNRYGFAWGGDYVPPTLPDAMHHEFMGTPAQAVAATVLARSELSGSAPLPVPPPPAPAPSATMPAPKTSPLTGHLEIPGFDCSYAKPGRMQMQAGSFTFMVGYVSPMPGKNLSAASYADYRSSTGMGVGLVFEDSATRVTGGAAAGSIDGALADRQADSLGYPIGSPIFFTVDVDLQPGSYSALQAYAKAFNAATKRPVGVYGSGAVLNLLVTPGQQPVRYGWLAMSTGWSGYATVPPAKVHLLQRVGHPGWPVPSGVSATDFDEDVALLPLPLAGWDGSTPAPAPAPAPVPPPPRPAPAPVPPPPPPANPGKFAWTLPLGDYYGNIAGPAQSHGGAYAVERPHVANIQRWLVYHGCTTVAASRWAVTTWADGKWTAETDVAMGLWHDRFYRGQTYRLRCYRDDYTRLTVL